MVGRNMTEEQREGRGKETEKDKGKGGEIERRRGGTRTVKRSEKEFSSEEQRYGGQTQLSSLFLLTFETKRKEKRDH